MSKLDTCGIEVSCKELVVSLRRQGELEPLRNFTNTPEGREMVVRYLRRAGRVVRVCLESSGLYGLDLALALSAAPGLEVMVANPRAVRHFAHALMKRSKSDPVDAGVLEEFAACMPFQAWPRPSPAALADVSSSGSQWPALLAPARGKKPRAGFRPAPLQVGQWPYRAH
jgi:transposase